MSIIEVNELVKRFPKPGKEKGDILAVDNISFSVKEGETFGLLGPNGAGKTTTLEIIEGLQEPTSGTTSVLGKDSQKDRKKVKEKIGIQLQSSSFFDYLNLTEMLNVFGSLYHREVDADKLLEIVELTEKRKAMVKHLSGGQQQRFSIAVSLVNDPKVIFLDEPTTGLDPQSRHHMWEFISKVNDQGKTIVLTTHYMEEAEELCNRVGVIDHGKIVSLDAPEKLIKSLDSTARIMFYIDRNVDPKEFKDIEGVLHSEKVDRQYRLKVTHSSVALPYVYEWAKKKDVYLHGMEIQRANLEDVFLSLTGSKLRD